MLQRTVSRPPDSPLKTHTNLELSFEHLQTLEPIKYHANQYDKDLYRDDLIQWLIDNGLDAKYGCGLRKIVLISNLGALLSTNGISKIGL